MTDIYEANGARFIAADDMIVWWERKENKRLEPITTEWMFDVMASRPGAFVDVGASTGWFSIPMAIRGYDVHSFEPNPAVLQRLAANIELNGLEGKIAVREAAASMVPGEATFYNNPRVRLTSGGSIEAATCNSPMTRSVRTVTLDAELKGVAPALIKIDVEGHELAVLHGARRTIKQHRPHLMLEANTERHVLALADWLEEFGGYQWEKADERNMLCSPVS